MPLMESMGCNPELMLQSIKGTFAKELQESATKDPAILKQLALLSNPNSFINQLDLMLGVKPQIPSVERILGAYRAWKCMANLGKVVLSSIPDMISFVSELQNNGIPLLQSYANLLQVVTTGFNGKARKEVGGLLGIAVDSLISHNHSRFAGEYPVSGSIFKLN